MCLLRLVHLVGVEPTLSCENKILSLAGLPIPPQMHETYPKKSRAFGPRLTQDETHGVFPVRLIGFEPTLPITGNRLLRPTGLPKVPPQTHQSEIVLLSLTIPARQSGSLTFISQPRW